MSTLELDLMPDHSVVIRIKCDSAYEAAIVFEDLSEASQTGSVCVKFETSNRRVVIDDTGRRR